ncbi:MAG: hypothetical protein DWQ04_31860 [Chloroflexi bacterium]|nr:MAG: hypothetical protein DWQ04_31860 [Chloroflexota bacterium]
MNLLKHPEYKKYLADRELVDAVRAALVAWMDGNEAAGDGLKTAVSHLTTLFQKYNQVMWQAYPFCRMCLGGCCVVGASEVTPIDVAALTVLGHDLPVLPEQTHHDERACVYLGEQGCTWPADWRPLKCMTFFSLGSGDWQLESADEDYGRLTQALQAIFEKYLPTILGEDHAIDVRTLVDPIQFAPMLSRALADVYLPEGMGGENGYFGGAQYRRLPTTDADPISSALMFIAEVIEQIVENPNKDDDTLLADLEQFEWILTGQPSKLKGMLGVLNGRYATTSSNSIHAQFSQHIQFMLHHRF